MARLHKRFFFFFFFFSKNTHDSVHTCVTRVSRHHHTWADWKTGRDNQRTDERLWYSMCTQWCGDVLLPVQWRVLWFFPETKTDDHSWKSGPVHMTRRRHSSPPVFLICHHGYSSVWPKATDFIHNYHVANLTLYITGLNCTKSQQFNWTAVKCK